MNNCIAFVLRRWAAMGSVMISSGGEPTNMGTMTKLLKQLKKERDQVQKQLSGLNAAISAFAGVYAGTTPKRKKRTLSAAGRKRIAAAQRARWAKVKAGKKKA
jgi:hypothetical protein